MTLCRHLAGEGTETQVFIRAALYLEQPQQCTGLGADALEEKVHALQEEVARLEPLAQELEGCQQELEHLEERRQSLRDEVSQIEKRLEPLGKDVAHKEQREMDLIHRVQETVTGSQQ